MGKVFSVAIKRPARNWNAENRAQKFIDKQEHVEQPKRAPRHTTSEKLIDDYAKEHASAFQEQQKKNESLLQRLNGMVVDTPKPGELINTATRRLPEDRSKFEELGEFGYLEPTVIRNGRCTIRQAMEFVGNHFMQPDTHSVQQIAEQYKLDKHKVQQVLRYFQVYHIQMPKAGATDEVKAKALKRSLPVGYSVPEQTTDSLEKPNTIIDDTSKPK